jgi:hypothetical protein
MFEHVQEQPAAAWSQRAMAGLPLIYVAMLVASVPAAEDPTFTFWAVLLAVPLAIRGASAFRLVCAVWAALVLVLGGVMATRGWYVYWPVILPLLMAVVRVPERLAPVVFSCVTLVLGLALYAFVAW